MYHKSRIEVVQALRGIASIGVLLWHCSFFVSPYGSGLGTLLFYPASTMAVDLFFVICGFVMVVSCYSSDGLTISPRLFFIKRAARIIPLYTVYTLTIMAMEVASDRHSWDLLIRSLAFYPEHNAAYPNIFSPSLIVGWSIQYEVYFYIAVFVSLFFKESFFRFLVFVSIVTILAPRILTGIPLFDPYYQQLENFPALAIATNPLNFLFLAGMAIGLIYRSNFSFPNKYWSISLSAAAIIALITQYTFHWKLNHGIHGVGTTVIIFLFILTIASKNMNFAIPRAVLFLGNISFSLYLSHPTAIWIYIYTKNVFGIINPFGGWLAIFLVFSISIVLSIITYHFVEVKFSKWLVDKLQNAIIFSIVEEKFVWAKEYIRYKITAAFNN
ncbi:acyltransferase [Rhizobium sp. LjRoot30]|uniref:acyltransferase family protein n=1 Tax=Rhizobium sp. LjRoot30 TaxID=3342320 RepID=UPI003ECEA462